MTPAIVRIGGASGFWGDSAVGAPQLVHRGAVDYLVFDYLAELTMAILAAARAKDPQAGYAADFVTVAMKSVLRDLAAQKIRVISNAGGMNPAGCARALAKLAADADVALRIAVVEGDDVLPLVPALRGEDVREMFTGAPLPARLASANAYLGALPIVRALERGADVVITGRCVDSAVTLAPLIHAFGWQSDDYDRLAAGSLAGHLIECGCQATGGLYTDWEDVPRWEDIGYPILECTEDGSFVVTKAPDTGGIVTPAVLAEQLLYEIGDPAEYVLPDVVCDFSEVRMQADGEHRVRVTGACGAAPTDRYKLSATYVDGFRSSAQLTIIGIDAARKAERTGEAILARTRAMFRTLGLPDYNATRIEVLGAESVYGPHARARSTREVVLRLTVHHPAREALEIFTREIAPAGTSWSPGTTGASGRPNVSPLVKLFSFTLPKSSVTPRVTIDGVCEEVPVPTQGGYGRVRPSSQPAVPASDREGVGAPCVRERDALASPCAPERDALAAPCAPAGDAVMMPSASPADDVTLPTAPPADDVTFPTAPPGDEVTLLTVPPGHVLTVPLIALAHGRSGDKGDDANIGIIARDPSLLPLLRAQLTPAAVKAYFAHLVTGEVERFEVPGIHALNFVLHNALGGGGMTSLRNDPLGKGFAQMLLDFPVRVPSALAAALGKHARSDTTKDASKDE